MTLAQLSYIVALDSYRHFARAAQHCHVTQPTLSMQVQKLERELGVELFDRSKHPVEPTDLGRQIIEQARVILGESARMREIIAEAGEEVAGELRIGILPTLAPYLLPRFVLELVRRYPRISLQIEELQTHQILSALRADHLDAALVATPTTVPGLIERPLFEEPFVAYISTGHRLHARQRIRSEDLTLEDLWLLNEGHCFRDQVLALCGERAKSPRRIEFESGNLETLKRLVETNGGLTLLPYLATADLTEEERKRIRPFHAPTPTRLIRLIQRKTYLKRSLIEAFVTELLRCIPANLGLVSAAGGPRNGGSTRSHLQPGRRLGRGRALARSARDEGATAPPAPQASA
jgi:LysR family hydrogen peroxide-inducible transcriptional activator